MSELDEIHLDKFTPPTSLPPKSVRYCVEHGDKTLFLSTNAQVAPIAENVAASPANLRSIQAADAACSVEEFYSGSSVQRCNLHPVID